MKTSLLATSILLAGVFNAWAGLTLPQLRISLENSRTHVQTRAVSRFAKDLQQQLSGQLEVTVFVNAGLFRDRDIIQALARDKVEMAVPGTWHITRFEPSVGIFLLPVFYGRTALDNYRVTDSDIGTDINRRIETHLGLKVVGRWIDLGHAHIFGVNRSIRTRQDLKDLRIRVAGGLANKLRVEILGARPLIIAWPDLPEHMMRNRVDAVLTSYETIRSAALWDKGVTSVFEDMQYFPRYVPLIRQSFWRKLTPGIKAAIQATWERHVDGARQMAAQAQADAKTAILDRGIRVTVPGSESVEATRALLMTRQNVIAEQTGIDPALVTRVTDLLNN